MSSLVSQISPASPERALQHFSQRLAFETDCSDVYSSQQQGTVDFVLVDVRSEAAFASAHVPGAINIPHRLMTATLHSHYPMETLFVIYCAGPHCNGVHRAAINLSQLGYVVKEMIGGVIGWRDEGLPLVGSTNENTVVVSCGCSI
ncbi:putative rhodanese-like protein [Yersinia enterocolitica]|uniref:rhodanese-like domain-containing protein n=1 Tax=Yersinia enterocolitica TaxID=630 RepID=UPI0002819428|nr:rhodanese-like domain-containing protein [Yersinia enterocolitica]AJI82699.1 rhodanese-like domain protein [Yersinia enterocolitica]EKA26724.1 putative rhodanese-like protein [Yersinia enterocolitica subsp. enterocolitica WA-314]ELI8283591.1 rhodanese-like domain-containing protein [Yersinia enterocolitica]KGA76892.1 rhodanese-like domain protein [Yersinia enterocolitica]MCE3128578.1 rhodanese-like domain-containing protein [Yersinia enterocolitica]